jgi:hypothetical protein
VFLSERGRPVLSDMITRIVATAGKGHRLIITLGYIPIRTWYVAA